MLTCHPTLQNSLIPVVQQLSRIGFLLEAHIGLKKVIYCVYPPSQSLSLFACIWCSLCLVSLGLPLAVSFSAPLESTICCRVLFLFFGNVLFSACLHSSIIPPGIP
ncbi:hypothetical protein BO71DRAFT_68052 [Aspergillus ellipticus CBS 707.79]|uniref:Uncharacterized protein n=1 Tax=Aspergillus ellipticus CBS 707.79 TaxID=1448320 RepID=A0A319D0F9_9EURO|nr:hypothetical protein BO71DRAFT_68052 [Aspergillus ellipticus CBS 707.79]